jgi:carbon storage regulator CsrA
MLVLTRKNRESIVIARPDDLGIVLEITILEIEGGRVRIGFQADTKLPIHRREVWDRICNGHPTNGAVGVRSGELLAATPGQNGAARHVPAHPGPGETAGPPLLEAARQAGVRAATARASTTVHGA